MILSARTIRRKHRRPKIIDLGQLIEWAENNTSVPEDQDKPFVIDFKHSNADEELKFQIVVSTRRMIAHCVSQNIICVDVTYKLNWNGYPFIVVGAIDRCKKFHPLCFALCSHESTYDYSFVFQTLVNTVQKLHNDSKFEPAIVISDAADAIKNTVDIVFPSAQQVMCFVHVLRDVEKQKFNQKQSKKTIIKDIGILQLSPSRSAFKKDVSLFLWKWSKTEKEFTDYFKANWIKKHCNWYEANINE